MEIPETGTGLTLIGVPKTPKPQRCHGSTQPLFLSGRETSGANTILGKWGKTSSGGGKIPFFFWVFLSPFIGSRRKRALSEMHIFFWVKR